MLEVDRLQVGERMALVLHGPDRNAGNEKHEHDGCNRCCKHLPRHAHLPCSLAPKACSDQSTTPARPPDGRRSSFPGTGSAPSEEKWVGLPPKWGSPRSDLNA